MTPIESALTLPGTWPVGRWAAAVAARGRTQLAGETNGDFHIASVTKLLTAWAIHVAVEEGTVSLEDPVGQKGCTLAHLLSHSGGYPFEGSTPIGIPGAKRIYSNLGYEMAAEHVERTAGISFARYLREAVLEPLGMTATALAGSPAKDAHSTAGDLALFAGELLAPRLISADSRRLFATAAFPDLDGVVPGFGHSSPCPWGMGAEIRGHKDPHWTGRGNSASTFGHFGASGAFLWVDPVADVACAVLTDTDFDTWAKEAWPVFSDAVLTAAAEVRQ
jgi:CubicO group peptidase (beta-lactamase class C family)